MTDKVNKKKIKCNHGLSKSYNNWWYCPDCGLCMETFIKNGKKYGRSYYDLDIIDRKYKFHYSFV